MLTSDFISFHRSSGFYGAETSCNFSSWCFGYFYGNAKFDPLVDSAPSGIYYWEYRAIPLSIQKRLDNRAPGGLSRLHKGMDDKANTEI